MKTIRPFFCLLFFWTVLGFAQPGKWSVESTERSEIAQYTRSLHFLDRHLQKAGITAEQKIDFENLDEQIRSDLQSEMRMVKVKEEKFWRFGKENPDMLIGSEAEVWRMVNRERVSNEENSDPVAFLLKRVKFDSILKVDEKVRLASRLRLSESVGDQSNAGIVADPFQTPAGDAISNPSQHLLPSGSPDPLSALREPTQTTPTPSGFPIIPVAIVVAVIAGSVLYFLRRKSI